MRQRTLFDTMAPDTFGDDFTLENAKGVGKVSGGHPTPFEDGVSRVNDTSLHGGCRVSGEISPARARAGARKHTDTPTPTPTTGALPEKNVLQKVSEKVSGGVCIYPTPSDRFAAYGICRPNFHGLCTHSRMEQYKGERGLLCCDECGPLAVLPRLDASVLDAPVCPIHGTPWSYRGKLGLQMCDRCRDEHFPGDKRKGVKWRNN